MCHWYTYCVSKLTIRSQQYYPIITFIVQFNICLKLSKPLSSVGKCFFKQHNLNPRLVLSLPSCILCNCILYMLYWSASIADTESCQLFALNNHPSVPYPCICLFYIFVGVLTWKPIYITGSSTEQSSHNDLEIDWLYSYMWNDGFVVSFVGLKMIDQSWRASITQTVTCKRVTMCTI